MSNIRRQSIISSVIIYIGFGIGLFNMFLFTRDNPRIFEDAQFGLYNAFIAIATMMMAFSSLAMPTYIYKFFPYYKDHLPDKKNDQVTIALVITAIGFLIVVIAGIAFKQLVIRKYIGNSPEIIAYYKWIFPLGFGLLVYTVLEAYAWQLHKSVFTNLLREVLWRLFTTCLIVLFATGIIENFDVFIKLFAFSYPFIALVLLIYLVFTKKIHFTFRLSKVTKRFSSSILRLCSFVYTGSLIFTVSLIFDSLVISSVLDNALTMLAIYSVAQNFGSMIQAPQRSIIAASIAHLSRAWKEKKRDTIQRIYQRSSINLLIFACGIFLVIMLNFTDAVYTFKLKETYLDAYYVVLLLGLTKVIDMGTGVNSQIIATSIYWRFEMISGIILLSVMLPLSYFLTKEYGIIGTAAAQLVSISVYNLVRILFLWKKFRLQPFTKKTFFTLLLGASCFALCFFAFSGMDGIPGIVIRSLVFIGIYAAGAYWLKLSPDIQPVLNTFKRRLGMKI